MKKKVFVTLFVIIVIAAGGLILTSSLSKNHDGHYQLSVLKKGDLENTVSSTGTLSAVETVEVGSQVSGILKSVNVDFNDTVKKDQVLAVLDKTLFEVAVKDAEAGVLRAEAKLQQARAEQERNVRLYNKEFISEKEFLVTKTAAQTAEADLTTAQAALKRAQTNLEYTVIRSPIEGTVIERAVDAGQTIAASFQAPKLFVIAEDLTRMQIETNVDESDIGLIKKDQPVRFTVQAYPDDIFDGVVRQIRLQPQTIQNVVNYTVVVDASNHSGKLLPGMTATVDFIVEQRKHILLVPNTALNYVPSTDEMKKHKKQLMAQMKDMHAKASALAANHGHTMPGTRGSLPESIGRVFYLDKNELPHVALFVKGVSDGIHTEVLQNTGLKEGMEIITSYKTEKEKSSKKASFILPPPRH